MMFINFSDSIGWIIGRSAATVTGNLYLSLFLVLIFSVVISIILRLPVDLTVIFTFPMVIVGMAYMGEWVAFGGLILIYLAMVATKIFFLKN